MQQQPDLIRRNQIQKYKKKYSVQEKIEYIELYYLKNLIMSKKEFAKEQHIPDSTFKGWLKWFGNKEQNNYARFKDAIAQANKQLIRDMNQEAIRCLINGQNVQQIKDALRKSLVQLLEKYFYLENEFTCLIPVKFRNANKKNTLYLFVNEQMNEYKQYYLEQQYLQQRNDY